MRYVQSEFDVAIWQKMQFDGIFGGRLEAADRFSKLGGKIETTFTIEIGFSMDLRLKFRENDTQLFR